MPTGNTQKIIVKPFVFRDLSPSKKEQPTGYKVDRERLEKRLDDTIRRMGIDPESLVQSWMARHREEYSHHLEDCRCFTCSTKTL